MGNEKNITSGDGDQGASNFVEDGPSAEPSGGVVAPENQEALESAAADEADELQEKGDPSRVSSDESSESTSADEAGA